MTIDTNTADISVKDTGAHGPPKGRRPLMMLAAFGIAVAGLIGPAAAAQAAPTPRPAAASHVEAVGPAQTEAPQHAVKGTKINIMNGSSHAIQIGDTWLPPKPGHGQPYDIDLEGASGSGDDISSSFRVDVDGPSMPLYGHNPATSSAYLQVGGQKIFESSSIMAGGVKLDVKFHSGNIDFKKWTITAVDDSIYDHSFVHHTGENDGVKGFVRNEAKSPVTFETNGHPMTLKPGEKMIYFDARRVMNDELGTTFTVSGNGDRGYHAEVVDPYVGRTFAKVQQVEGEGKDFRYFSEGDSSRYEWGGGMTLTVKRENYAKLPVAFENWHTEDWANYTFTITDR